MKVSKNIEYFVNFGDARLHFPDLPAEARFNDGR